MQREEFPDLLAKARSGDREALGLLLNAHRNYLLAIANAELNTELSPKAGGSDLVQQTFCEAAKDINQFDGQAEAELAAWLRKILLNNLADLKKRYFSTDARDVRREVSADQSNFVHELRTDEESPSAHVASLEDQERLAKALALLTDEYRQVIELRNRDKRRFAEIALIMNRSEDATRMLWNRAIARLQDIFGSTGEP